MTAFQAHIAPRRFRRVGLALLAVALAAAALALGWGPVVGSANGAVVDAVCTTEGTLFFDPGLTLTARPTSFHGGGTFFPCVSTNVIRGDFTGQGSGVLSCAGGSVNGTLAIDWVTLSGGTAHSSVHFTVEAAVGPNGGLSFALDGAVTGGLFQGSHYRSTFAAAGIDPLDCASPAGAGKAVGAGTSVIGP